jgi:hypothetical protein
VNCPLVALGNARAVEGHFAEITHGLHIAEARRFSESGGRGYIASELSKLNDFGRAESQVR